MQIIPQTQTHWESVLKNKFSSVSVDQTQLKIPFTAGNRQGTPALLQLSHCIPRYTRNINMYMRAEQDVTDPLLSQSVAPVNGKE